MHDLVTDSWHRCIWNKMMIHLTIVLLAWDMQGKTYKLLVWANKRYKWFDLVTVSWHRRLNYVCVNRKKQTNNLCFRKQPCCLQCRLAGANSKQSFQPLVYLKVESSKTHPDPPKGREANPHPTVCLRSLANALLKLNKVLLFPFDSDSKQRPCQQ